MIFQMFIVLIMSSVSHELCSLGIQDIFFIVFIHNYELESLDLVLTVKGKREHFDKILL